MDRIETLSATKTKIHIPCPTRSFRLGLIDVVQRLHKLRTYLLTETALPRIFNTICFIRYSRPRKSALHKLCTNIDQPYLIWAAVLCDVSILHQKTNDTGTKNPTEKGVVAFPWWLLQTWSCSKDEVRPANYIFFKLIIIVAVSTKIEQSDVNNCGKGYPR